MQPITALERSQRPGQAMLNEATLQTGANCPKSNLRHTKGLGQ